MTNFFNKIWYHGSLYKFLLFPFTLIFYFIVKLRLLSYQLGFISKVISQTPVVVIGNISVGGTGKTPFIIYLTQQLMQAGLKVAVVSRGYGRDDTKKLLLVDGKGKGSTLEQGDEPVLINAKTSAPVVVAASRANACEFVDKHCDVDVILSDDGLQHYNMARAIEWCLVDKQRGFGNKWLLPAGPLREPMSRLKTVDEVITQNTDDTFLATDAAFYLTINEAYLLNDVCQKKPLSDFVGKATVAIAGIANPNRFFTALADKGLSCKNISYPDHYSYKIDDFKQLDKTKTVFITEKDAIKCSQFDLPNIWVVPVVIKTSKKLDAAIKQLIDAVQQKRLTNG